ncbi:MAG: queuosine precursor transporter [Legionellales bacterium]|nr:queuosine precursor transporter [Legionellales bacterium]
MSIMLFNAIMTNRYVGYDNLYVLGGTLTAPFIFILDDIIAEIYGYKITQTVIIAGYTAQTLFALLAQVILLSPSPGNFTAQTSYATILGLSLLRINFSGFVANIAANLMNSYIISRWKILLKGKHFWLRSLVSSTIAEAFYSFLAILMMELKSIPFHDVLKVVLLSYAIKAGYSAFFAWPANIIVNIIKRKTGIDIYDLKPDFTPEKFLTPKES